MNKFKERKEVNKREATVICLQPQGNLVKEPEVGSKFPGSRHPHCAAKEMTVIMNNDSTTLGTTAINFSNRFYQHFFPLPQLGVKNSSHIHTHICLSVLNLLFLLRSD